MRISMITNHWKGSGGGVQAYVQNLVKGLRSLRHDVKVLYLNGKDSESIKICNNKFLFPFKAFLALKEIRPSVVHCQEAWFCLLAGVIYKKIYGCNLIYTFHSEPIEKFPLPASIFYQALLNACDHVTFVSKRLHERVIEINGFSFKRTEITYAGVKAGEVSDFEEKQFREAFGISEDSIVLLAQAMTASQLKAEGLQLLIRAVAILRDVYPDIVIIATREGNYSESLKAFARELNMERQIIFTGDVENPFVPLRICHLYTHTPLGEGGVSLSLLEAMAVGKPIIATQIGGIPEAITDGQNGILVKPEPELIADKIDLLLKNQEFSVRIAENAKKTVEDRFTWERTTDTFIDIYKNK